MTSALLTFLALDCVFRSALLAQRLHVVGIVPEEVRPFALICGGLLVAGAGLLMMAGAA